LIQFRTPLKNVRTPEIFFVPQFEKFVIYISGLKNSIYKKLNALNH